MSLRGLSSHAGLWPAPHGVGLALLAGNTSQDTAGPTWTGLVLQTQTPEARRLHAWCDHLGECGRERLSSLLPSLLPWRPRPRPRPPHTAPLPRAGLRGAGPTLPPGGVHTHSGSMSQQHRGPGLHPLTSGSTPTPWLATGSSPHPRGRHTGLRFPFCHCLEPTVLLPHPRCGAHSTLSLRPWTVTPMGSVASSWGRKTLTPEAEQRALQRA